MSGPAAVEHLVREWPEVLGRIAIVSRWTPTPFSRPLRAEDLDLMKPWEGDPEECIRELLEVVFRREGNFGSFEDRAGDAVTSVYILVYLCARPELAWELLRIFVPILRPGLWDDELRWYLELMFFEHAWEAVFDFDHLREPELHEDFDWPGSLNHLDDAERNAMLAYAGLEPLPDPERPAVAAWNERWFDVAWLWELPAGELAAVGGSVSGDDSGEQP